jgi:meiotic recombination protein DMC1
VHSTHRAAPSCPAQRKDNIHIKTGADTLDAILGGGVPTRTLTEMFGEWRYAHTHSGTACALQT